MVRIEGHNQPHGLFALEFSFNMSKCGFALVRNNVMHMLRAMMSRASYLTFLYEFFLVYFRFQIWLI
jgi:hypothetical protein